MDKELLRIVIIATGFLVILGMILWHYFTNKDLDDDEVEIKHEKVIGSPDAFSDSLKLHSDRDEFDIIPVGSARRKFENEDADWDLFNGEKEDDFVIDENNVLPDILQFGVVARDDEGFNGVELTLVFGMVDLEYGDMKVFERINKDGGVDYGVACMVEPGTFPEGEYLASFNCPGIVFYLQHKEMDDPQNVYDDFIDTIKTVAKELDGVVWDHQRQPLTEETIESIRRSL